MLARPTPVDSEIAAITFKDHLDSVWAEGLATNNGWGRFDIDRLHSVAIIWATRPDGTRDHYFVSLGAEFYDRWPPRVRFVDPADWKPVQTANRWWPTVTFPPWMQFHLNHGFNGEPGQLICFSFTAEYYMVDHQPEEAAVWKPGAHTVAATLTKLQEVLRPPYYQKPSA
jgi:hypothetical protein